MGTCIPLWLLRDLKCRHCKYFLSCGPVYVTPDCGLLCGRCRALAKPNFRNYVYEELAVVFRFPCFNWEKLCPEEGPWNSLKDHELDCPYSSSCKLICTDPAALFSSKRVLPSEESLLYIEVPEKCLNLICCKNCGKYLSCDPVHINVVGSNICHRCYLSNGIPPNTLRNLAYEKIAYIFRFPCIFRAKGCPIKMKFGRDCWEHESSCHYKDITMPSSPTTPSVEPDYFHSLTGIDNSGYRPSYEGCSSPNHEPQGSFELPRISFILRDPSIMKEIRNSKSKTKEGNEKVSPENKLRDPRTPQVSKPEQNIQLSSNHSKNADLIQNSPNHPVREMVYDKEKGVVPTHTGHVYATLTSNTILFAPPQIQQNKDQSGRIKIAQEFQDKLRRNKSNASENSRDYKRDYQQPEQEDTDFSENLQRRSDFAGLNKYQTKKMEGFDPEYAPDVKEYVHYNPQNNIQRNNSMTIGNADLIAELKMKQQRRKNKLQDENANDIRLSVN